MFIAALFIIIQTWKQQRCPLVGEWVYHSFVVHPDNEILFSPKKENKRKENPGNFPGGPVVKSPRFHCSGRGFDPWSGN